MQTLTLASWNILSDEGGFFNTEPQNQRLKSITQTIADITPKPDIVGLLEVEDNRQSGHHGRHIAQSLQQLDGVWSKNPTSDTSYIYMGIFGLIDSTCSYELPGYRSFMIGCVGELAICLVHFTYNIRNDNLRSEQAKQVLSYLNAYKKVVIMGDFNSASWQPSRRIIEASGFESVFRVLGRRRPATVMTEKYRRQLPLIQRLATTIGFSPDDIYVRGLNIRDAGVFEGDSDHRGIWATVKN